MAFDLERFVFLNEALAASAAIDAATRLGVLDRLVAGPGDAATVARDCAIGERGAAALLTALASLGLAETVAGGLYRAAGHGGGTPSLPWDRLAAVIREDRSTFAGDTPPGAESYYPEVVPHLGSWFASAASEAARHLGGNGLRVLDVGAGAAPWSLALVRRDPTCRVTAVDLPAVLPATRQAVEGAGCQAQFSYLAGDLFKVEWGRHAYDLAVAGNICHLFDAGTNLRLLKRLSEALRPGGRVALIDQIVGERLDGPRPVALYALGLLLRSNRGRVYPLSVYASWLREAGFETPECIELPGPLAVSLIVARAA